MRKHKKGGYKKKKEQLGLRVDVKNNNVEFALKKFKRKVKDSGMILEIKKRSFYEKPSEIKREKRNLAKLRNKYNNQKQKNSF
jgi:small subunit ribosomal protein S21